MKQKHADRPNWGRILIKRYFQEYISNDEYEGYISYLLLDKAKETLTVKYDTDEICIVDDGFSWMMFFPKNKLYSLTVMINQDYKVLQWYFDIIKSMELTNEGIPLINDMYLDYVVLPNGKLIVKDEEELKNALIDEIISDEEFKIALHEGMKLKKSITEHRNELINNIDKYIEGLKKYREG